MPRGWDCGARPLTAPGFVASPNTRSAAGVAKRRTPVKASAKNETLEWVKSVGIAIVLFLFIRTFLVQA